jgi:hypothetical protein
MPESSSFRSRVRRFTLVVVLADGGLPSRGESSTRAELADRTTIGPRPVSCSLLQDGGPAPRHSEPSRSIRRAREICQLACSGTVAALGEMNRAGMF